MAGIKLWTGLNGRWSVRRAGAVFLPLALVALACSFGMFGIAHAQPRLLTGPVGACTFMVAMAALGAFFGAHPNWL